MEGLLILCLTSIGGYFFLRLENLADKLDQLEAHLLKLEEILARIMDT